MNIFKNNRRLSYLTLWLQNTSITLISTTPGRHLQVLRSDFPSQPHCHCGHFFHSVTEIFFPSNLFHCLIPDPNHLMSRQFPACLSSHWVCVFLLGAELFSVVFSMLTHMGMKAWAWIHGPLLSDILTGMCIYHLLLNYLLLVEICVVSKTFKSITESSKIGIMQKSPVCSLSPTPAFTAIVITVWMPSVGLIWIPWILQRGATWLPSCAPLSLSLLWFYSGCFLAP